MKKTLATLGIMLFSLVTGCRNVGISWWSLTSEPSVPDTGEGWLMFDLRPLENSGTLQKFDCTFQSEGKTAHFQFELTSREASGDPPIAFTSGKLIAVPGSDARVFLHQLQKTLGAKTLPVQPLRVAELPFTAAILGTNQSHSKDGGFFTKPSGNWTAMKIFIGKKDDPAEVFLNFNTALRKGEFSIKDSDYGDDVLKELAKVL
jgi:hypothetical protein